MIGITTHILDTSRGCPAAGVPVTLEVKAADGAWRRIGEGTTGADGRLGSLTAGVEIKSGIYRLHFDTAAYARSSGSESFFPRVTIEFEIRDEGAHYHVPLLLSPFGYSTYRGS